MPDPTSRYETCVIFGGTGFIGLHFARHLLRERLSDRIVLCDIVPPGRDGLDPQLARAFEEGTVRFLEVDVRRPIDHPELAGSVDLVLNLAAVHREPGHEPAEYYETNLLGAENVCSWSAEKDADTMVFTSSIAPYGPGEAERNERSLPVPATPYGASKLAAEKIHMAWQREAASRRKLVIVRPGVVFGPGEGGNFSRMIRALNGRYFFNVGSLDTKKAGGYVKELCHTIVWALSRAGGIDDRVILYNFTLDPSPTIREYVNAVCEVAGIRRFIPRIPYFGVHAIARVLETFATILNRDNPLSPVRVRKLISHNNIVAEYLRREHYEYRYSLEQALADWRRERPDEWGR